MISIEIFIVLSEVFLLFIWLTWCLCPGLSWTQGCCTCWCRWYRSPQGLVHGSRFFQKILVFPFCAQITIKPSFWLKIWPLGHCCCCLKSFFSESSLPQNTFSEECTHMPIALRIPTWAGMMFLFRIFFTSWFLVAVLASDWVLRNLYKMRQTTSLNIIRYISGTKIAPIRMFLEWPIMVQ